MVSTFDLPLPHGITLSCRAAGERGRPLLVFLHGFPEAAFVWDGLLEHFARPENGGYRCVAPNLRGFERSSAPADPAAYRPKHLVQDIVSLVTVEGGHLAALVAHDWGGAVAWNLANQQPGLLDKLVIVNSPHPGTFLRGLKSSPEQQQASAYMNFLIRPDAEALLAADGYARLWRFFKGIAGDDEGRYGWLTDAVKAQYHAVWDRGLTGGCNYYRASPLRPPRPEDPAAAAIDLPREMLTVDVPTLVVWGLDDTALPASLLDGLGDYIADVRVERVPGASHWIVHEQPETVIALIADFLRQ